MSIFFCCLLLIVTLHLDWDSLGTIRYNSRYTYSHNSPRGKSILPPAVARQTASICTTLCAFGGDRTWRGPPLASSLSLLLPCFHAGTTHRSTYKEVKAHNSRTRDESPSSAKLHILFFFLFPVLPGPNFRSRRRCSGISSDPGPTSRETPTQAV